MLGCFEDSSFPRRPGDVARLTSPLMEATPLDRPLCLVFWTHLFGHGVGSLRVVLATPTANRTLWSVAGPAGNTWHQAQLTLASSTPFRVRPSLSTRNWVLE